MLRRRCIEERQKGDGKYQEEMIAWILNLRSRRTLAKYCVSSNERHNKAVGEGIPSANRLPDAHMGQGVAIKSLGITGPLPHNERICHNGEVDQLACGHEIDELL
jgi:hypothetical protein